MSIVIEKAGGKFDLGTVRVVAADAAAETAAVDTGVEVWLAREAAEAAIGLGKNDPDFADTGPVSFFLAESCSLVFTTKKVPQSFQLHSAFFFGKIIISKEHSPQIGFVPVLVMIPAMIAAPK